MFRLDGKNVLLTGATGGIGASTAKILHKLGANLILSSTSNEKLEKLASEFEDRVTFKECNLEDFTAVENLVNEIDKLDILICNAGITKDNLALRMSNEQFDKVIDINLKASFIMNRTAIKKMIRQRWGRIINISSVVAFTGNIGQANYTASKAALVAMSKSLAQEVATRNVTINCIAPGFIVTKMTDVINDDIKNNLLTKIPMQKFGTPDDVANAIAFLSSEEASYITGQTLHVNGGMYMN